MGFLGGSVVKNLPLANAGGMSSNPGSGQRNLGGYSPRGHKDSDMTERLSLSSDKINEYSGCNEKHD